MLHCALLLLLCHLPVRVLAVSAAQTSLAFGDSINTERVRREWGSQFIERDPLARPFVRRPWLLYTTDANTSIALAHIAEMMRTSSRGWERHIWWLPQAVVMSGNVWGLAGTRGRR